MIKRLATLLTISSSIAGCAGIALPDADLCVADPIRGRFICQHLSTDYDVVGNRLVLKPGVPAKIRTLKVLNDVNRWTCTDPDGFAAIKAWGQQLQDKYSGTNCQ